MSRIWLKAEAYLYQHHILNFLISETEHRCKQIQNKSIANGGAPNPEVIPFVDPVIPQPQVPQPPVPQAPVPQNPNMFDQPGTDEIEQLTEEMEAIQILENLKARVKDDNLSIEQKLQFASDANQAIQNLLDNLIARNAPDDDKDRIKKALNFVNNRTGRSTTSWQRGS